MTLPLATYTAPDLAHARVYPTPTGYEVRFGYLTAPVDGTFTPSTTKPARSYIKEGSARFAAAAWVS